MQEYTDKYHTIYDAAEHNSSGNEKNVGYKAGG
jgi:hypothetical protein